MRNHAEVLRRFHARHPGKRKEYHERYKARYPGRVAELSRIVKRNRSAERILYDLSRERAKKAGVPFTISIGDIQVPDVCPVLGIPLKRGIGVLSQNSPTLDRFYPEKGYVPGNITVISMRANLIKTNAAVDEIEAVARWMRSRNGA